MGNFQQSVSRPNTLKNLQIEKQSDRELINNLKSEIDRIDTEKNNKTLELS